VTLFVATLHFTVPAYYKLSMQVELRRCA